MDSKDKKIDVGSEVNASGVDAAAEAFPRKAPKMDVVGAGMDPAAARRRQFLIAAIAASPVLMTLTSRPVHAVQALSNMLSTEGSGCRGNTRCGGMSPGFWKTFPGKTIIYNDTGSEAWDYTGYTYGTLKSGGSRTKWDDFTGGTTYYSVFNKNPPSTNGLNSSSSLREVFNLAEGSDEYHLIAGLLNCRYFDARAGGGVTLYFMTEAQFWDMYNNPSHVPAGYASLRDLIESNYHLLPSVNGQC